MRKALIAFILATMLALIVSATTCEVSEYFVSPYQDGLIESMIIAEIDAATTQIVACLYSFTDDQLSASLIRAAGRGVRVYVYLQKGQENATGGEACTLAANGVSVRISQSSGYFHHKFVVLDFDTVITGSYNWSDNADDDNFENAVVIQCRDIAVSYLNQANYLTATYLFASPACDSSYTPPQDAQDSQTNQGSCCNYVASRSSDKFHTPGCSYVGNILESNKVCYCTRSAAIADGKDPCSRCNP